ncbi:MAG: trypsin-like serine peptidase [Polyangiales bacterium]
MRARSCLFLIVGLVTACGGSDETFAGEITAPVVYGADDRVEVYNHPDLELREIARQSIVALVPSFRVRRESDGTHSLLTDSLKELRDLCDDESFGEQPTAASCSGVLIDEDLVLTAGHCVDFGTRCDSYTFVFNYLYDEPGALAPIRDEDVYACNRVVIRGSAVPGEFTPDFALIQLDRPVEGAQSPAVVRPATALTLAERIAMIGFGSGLPAKIDSGGSVAEPRENTLDYFVANVDAFQGHSGSATFDSENRLAGILIGGRTPDYVQSEDGSCTRVSVYDDVDAGELVHNIAPIVASLCDEGWDSGLLCGPEACGGEPCGSSPLPSSTSSGIYPGETSGCSVSHAPTTAPIAWLALLFLGAALRLRRRAA